MQKSLLVVVFYLKPSPLMARQLLFKKEKNVLSNLCFDHKKNFFSPRKKKLKLNILTEKELMEGAV
jgi:hypothetical protein